MTEQINSQPADSSVNLIPVAHYGQKNGHHAEGAEDLIVNYRPMQTSATEWAVLRPFVIDVARSVPFVRHKQTVLLLRALTRLAKWAKNTAMLPLEADILLDPDTIAEACSTFDSRFVAGSHQWVLLRAAEERGQEFSPRSLTDRDRSLQPLSADELAAAATRIATFTQDRDIRTANMAMGLSGGAGLTFKELLAAKTSDIASVTGGYNVTIRGSAPRTVAVLNDWTIYVDRALKVPTPDDWAICTGVNDPSSRLKHYLHRRRNRHYPDIPRLRSTWMRQVCGILTVGELVYAAGYRSAGSLGAFDPYLLRRADDALLPILRSAKAVTR
ncbi:hypothetical protein HUN58_02310 [Curtobacterium sp. Csp1]|uniref:hypothetical protein n=1 Tax=Curtobacterium sp. Csp1 TaxID=2495429 RepID=UPI0015980EF0|nr:hypothetical protein [Curtobacterium sp. Csp1]QKS18892.1 hypothetical protein HUN58_02310 [Curtobacterium sp. Csp1]